MHIYLFIRRKIVVFEKNADKNFNNSKILFVK